jgi:hypothetical protein
LDCKDMYYFLKHQNITGRHPRLYRNDGPLHPESHR